MWTVYRLFDADGACLYVGVSINVPHRLASHRAKPWGSEIATVKTHDFDDQEMAMAAERSAIRYERPAHNIMWNDHSDSLLSPAEQRLLSALSHLDDEAFRCDLATDLGLDRFTCPTQQHLDPSHELCVGCRLGLRKWRLLERHLDMVPEGRAA